MGKVIPSTYLLKDFDEAPFGLLSIGKGRIIKDCNKLVSQLFEQPNSSILKKRYTDYFPLIPSIENFITNKRMQPFVQNNLLINNKKYSITPVAINDSNHLICLLFQITKNKLSFDHISFKKILDSSLDEIFITDGDGNILFINATAKALYGELPEDLVGKNVILLEEEGYFSPALFPIVQKRKEKVSMIQRTKMGKTVHSIAYPSLDQDGELTHVIFNARDVTEIRYLREKIERSEALIETYKSELEELQVFQDDTSGFIAYAPSMRKIKQTVEKIAPYDTTVLITGESGVGKGVIANTIHKWNTRKEKPFIHINCGAIPESLIESELFGYEGGAFTGANKEGQIGLIEQANEGTLFLDEIGEMPINLQVKLLKVLQDHTFRRVGGNKDIKVNIRVIAATNQDLNQLIEKKLFREDLYYRLNVIPLHIPALRTRPEDISYMIDYFLEKYNEKYGLSKQLSLESENVLLRYNWPGNVRELENLLERLVITSESNDIKPSDLPDNITYLEQDDYAVNVKNIVTLKEAQEQMEEQLLRKAYEIDTSSYKIASMLGINQSTAHRKIKQYIKKRST